MATIKMSSVVSDIRGSIGGVVFSRNGGGAYAKARTVGTNPNSTAQQVVRAIMSLMYTAWSGVSAAVRSAWGVYAQNVPMPNRLGDMINLSGYNMYSRTKSVCDLIGFTMPATAPTIMTLAEQDPTIEIEADTAGQEISVTFDNTLGFAGEVGGALLVYQGRPQNAAVNSYDGPFKYIGKVDGAVVPPASPAAIASAYTIATGQKCFCQFRILRADGRLSTPFRASGTVVAGA